MPVKISGAREMRVPCIGTQNYRVLRGQRPLTFGGKTTSLIKLVYNQIF